MPILLWPRAFKALSKYSVFNSCSWTRDWTRVPRIGRQRLIHSTPREVPFCLLTGAWAGTAGSPWSQRIHAELGHPGAWLWDAQIHKAAEAAQAFVNLFLHSYTCHNWRVWKLTSLSVNRSTHYSFTHINNGSFRFLPSSFSLSPASVVQTGAVTGWTM